MYRCKVSDICIADQWQKEKGLLTYLEVLHWCHSHMYDLASFVPALHPSFNKVQTPSVSKIAPPQSLINTGPPFSLKRRGSASEISPTPKSM